MQVQIKDTSLQDRKINPKRLNTTKIALITISIIVATFITSIVYWQDVLTTDKTLSRANLRFAKVTRSDLRKEIVALGKIVVANSPTLYSSADGIVTYSVKAGDSVKRDQILLTVESPSLTSQYQQAKAGLDRMQSELTGKKLFAKKNLLDAKQSAQLAQQDLQIAQHEFERYKKGLEKKFISSQEYEKSEEKLHSAELKAQQMPEIVDLVKEVSETDIENMRLQIKSQQSVVDELTHQVDNLVIRSPVDGIVGNLALNQKTAVSLHQALITVIDLSHYEVEIDVPEHYAPDITPNMEADIKIDGQNYKGAVAAISPEIQAGQVKARLHFTGQEPQSLRQNQRISTAILLEVHKSVLHLPRGAYLDSDHGQSVFRIKGNKAQRVPIYLGTNTIDEIEVTNGLAENDEIIISDTSNYKDATMIYLVN